MVVDQIICVELPVYTQLSAGAIVTMGARAAFPVTVRDIDPTPTVANPVPVSVLQVSVKR